MTAPPLPTAASQESVGVRAFPWRPTCRADCAHLPKPCSLTGCRYNLRSLGGTRRRPRIGQPSTGCVLDLVDARGEGYTLAETGNLLGMTREAVRLIQEQALRKLRRECKRQGITWEEFCHAAPYVPNAPIDAKSAGDVRRWWRAQQTAREDRRRAFRDVRDAWGRFRKWAEREQAK